MSVRQGGAGIFVFTSTGKLIRHINYFGQAPHEFTDITAFTIDPHLNQICIWDVGSRSIKKYTYKGEFIKAYRTDALIRDFVTFKNEINLFILPHCCPVKIVKYHLNSNSWNTVLDMQALI